jgi:hypothetical protein
MSNYNYNPVPPRVWSRVQNPCTYTVPGSDYTQAFIPLTGETVSQAQADYQIKQINKGNILQYKGNSARLTKSQKYSQLARCAGPNRTKVFATQSETYTNPNTTGLLRVGTQTYPYPNQIVGAPNNISGPFEYNIQNPNDCSGNSVQDGGILVCGTFANPCTGEIIKQGITSAIICNPSSASDVPGTSILCWNNKVQTWFPRQRYFMNNSTDKWPINYKGLVSAITPNAPILTVDSYTINSVSLSWRYNFNRCLPISNFNIYQNGILIQTLPYTITSITINNLELCSIYSFYVTSISNSIQSAPSNTVDVYLIYPLSPTITSITAGNELATINWNPNLNCSTISSYLLYQVGISLPIQIIPFGTNTTTITSLDNCGPYSFYLISYDNIHNTYSEKSNIATTNIIPLAPTNISGTATTLTQITLSWSQPVCCATILTWTIYYSTSLFGPYTSQIVSYNPSNTSYINGLNNNTLYYIFMVTNSNNGDSLQSSTIEVTIPPLYPPISITGNATDVNQISLSWIPYTPSSVQVVTDWYIYYSPSSSGPGSPIHIINSSTTSTIINSLTNNTTYSIYITAYNSTYNIYSAASSPINVNVPLPFTPTTSSNFTGFLNNDGNYIIMFTGNITNNSQFNFIYNGISFNYILVGGGGGGASGVLSGGGAGGGGGGGEIYESTSPLISNIDAPISITIGAGGLGGPSDVGLGANIGGAGGQTSLSYDGISPIVTPILSNQGYPGPGEETTIGGNGGSGTGGSGGIGGQSINASGASATNSGAGGGGGAYVDEPPGGAGGNGATNNNSVYYYGTSFGAGGGGGNGNGGSGPGLGGNMYAGQGGPYTEGLTNNGQNAKSNYGGGGGGGAGGNSVIGTSGAGGNGGSGCVVFYFNVAP